MYEDIYGPKKDSVNSYPPMRGGSGGSGEIDTSDAECTNENDLASSKEVMDEAAGKQSRRVREEKGKASIIDGSKTSKEERNRK